MNTTHNSANRLFVALLLSLIPAMAFAHEGASLPYGSFIAGLTHPVVSWVNSLARLPNGNVVAGGNFSFNGAFSSVGVAEWDGATWSPIGPGLFQSDGIAATRRSSGSPGPAAMHRSCRETR